MPHIRVQRLCACDAQHHRAQNNEGYGWRLSNKVQGIQRVKGSEHARVLRDMPYTQRGDTHKPQQHDGAKSLADIRSAIALHKKQRRQNPQSHGQHIFLEFVVDDREAFHCRQHRNRWRYHAIAIKQTGAKHAHQHDPAVAARVVFDGVRCQRQHGDQTAFAFIVCAQNQRHILQAHDNGERPNKK